MEKQKKQKASEWKFKGRAGDKAQQLRKVRHGNNYAIFSTTTIGKNSQFTGQPGISQNCAMYDTTIFFFTSPLFQVRKDCGVVTLQDAKMKIVVIAGIAKTNQSMVEAESPVSNINARIQGQIVKVRIVETIMVIYIFCIIIAF